MLSPQDAQGLEEIAEQFDNQARARARVTTDGLTPSEREEHVESLRERAAFLRNLKEILVSGQQELGKRLLGEEAVDLLAARIWADWTPVVIPGGWPCAREETKAAWRDRAREHLAALSDLEGHDGD